jgi:hypothetical protein
MTADIGAASHSTKVLPFKAPDWVPPKPEAVRAAVHRHAAALRSSADPQAFEDAIACASTWDAAFTRAVREAPARGHRRDPFMDDPADDYRYLLDGWEELCQAIAEAPARHGTALAAKAWVLAEERKLGRRDWGDQALETLRAGLGDCAIPACPPPGSGPCDDSAPALVQAAEAETAALIRAISGGDQAAIIRAAAVADACEKTAESLHDERLRRRLLHSIDRLMESVAPAPALGLRACHAKLRLLRQGSAAGEPPWWDAALDRLDADLAALAGAGGASRMSTDRAVPAIDWSAVIEAAIAEQPHAVLRRALTPKHLNDHLALLFTHAQRSVGADQDQAAKVAQAMAALRFLLDRLHELASKLDQLPNIHEPPPPPDDLSDAERREYERMVMMNMPFHRAYEAVSLVRKFLRGTRVASDEALYPLARALYEIARGRPARLFTHPQPDRGRPKDMAHRNLIKLAVGIVEARLRAQSLCAPARRLSRSAFCRRVASCFADYGMPADAGQARITKETIANWHRLYSPVLQPGAALAAAKGPILPGLDEAGWRAMARNLNDTVLPCPDTGLSGSFDPRSPGLLESLADEWMRQLRACIEIERAITEGYRPRARERVSGKASRRRRS